MVAAMLKKIGLVLINVNITDITDESGYIEAMGRKAASEAIQSAEIDVAKQQMRGSIGVAEAKREQDVMVANADKVREIGTKEAEREKLVRLADLAKDAGIGKSRAELEQQSAIKDQERQMRVQVADAEAAAGRPALRAEYGDRLPVVLLDGVEHSYWEIDEPRLRRDLTGPGNLETT